MVLLDPDGHYTGLLRWLDELQDKGYVAAPARDRLLVHTDIAAALDACKPTD
ncbi:putative lysine decarboxylase family protein [Mycobacteroides abscessus MAB_030201_1075]|uniref:Putative lysine decarboxylase family protein n=1 Tax=Mycobacteroides abscessus MAB_030201_1075 TaxID=1335410 RepID=A0A829PJC6_9MYCO|nr:putative lysine decarboxylase family protein [Mycobacteroides abscessus MAB_030201_1075]